MIFIMLHVVHVLRIEDNLYSDVTGRTISKKDVQHE